MNIHSKRDFNNLKPGMHICCIAKDENEAISVSASFIVKGIKSNEKCIAITSQQTIDDILEKVNSSGVDTDKCLDSGQIEYYVDENTFVKDIFVDVYKIIDFLKQKQEEAPKSGYKYLRLVIDMNWICKKSPGSEWLKNYEEEIDYYITKSKYTTMCLYNEPATRPDILIKVMNRHTYLMIDDHFCLNSYYIPPDEMKHHEKKNIPLEIYRHIKNKITSQSQLEQKHRFAEEKLKELNSKYRVFIENFHGIAYYAGLDFKPIFFHGNVEGITGYTEKDFIAGKPGWDQVIYPDVSALGESKDKIHNVPNYSIVREYRILTKDGKIKWVREFCKNTCDESGKPAFVQGAIYDISDRKKYEEELVKTKNRLNFLIQSTPAVIFSCKIQPDYETTFISENIYKQLGYTSKEYLSDPHFWFEHIHPDDREPIIKNLDDITERGLHITEYRFLHKNGSYRWLHDESNVIYDEKENPVEIIGYVIDVTSRKEVEEELKKTASELDNFHQMVSSGEKSVEELKKEIEVLKTELEKIEKIK
ncbi:MAG: PAS domain-containing protein [Endomicrobiales bacterium]|nr:PAS domain-containing protein [Endomicrobiales bacterium]